MSPMIAVPVQPGDLELFGGDPYRSARSWHDAWMKSERIREVAQAIEQFDREQGLLDTFTGSWAVHPPILDQAEALFAELRAALAELASKDTNK